MKKLLLTTGIVLTFSLTLNAQLKGLVNSLTKKAVKTPEWLEKHPITTSLNDVKWMEADKDGFTPREAERSLMVLQRTPNGGFILQPGYYIFQDQSYCLKAGTHGPGGGDGYAYAPPMGPAEEAVMTIVRKSVNHPGIAQHEIQVLLWAIIARSKFEDLQPKLKLTAALLLSKEQLAMLNRNAVNFLPEPVMNQLKSSLPPLVQQIIDAENRLRGMLTNANSSFEEMERVAVLTGMAPRGEGSQDIPSGRWSLHPDGYYIRYIPSGYSTTKVEIWVPQGSPSVGKEYDPATHIAVPGNTARQRLIQSGRAQSM